MGDHAEFQRVREHMSKVLASEHAKRRVRIDNDADWVDLEQETMHAEVNAERSRRSLPYVSRADIGRVDNMASGHSDYARKFALYCAELAVGINEVKP